MKKLILSLFIFLFIITSSQKSALVGTWKSSDGSVISFSQNHITADNKNLPYRYLSDETLLVFKNGKAHKVAYILSFDKNRLTVFGKEFSRAHRKF